MSVQKLVIGLVVIAAFSSVVVFPGYAQSQGKKGNGGNFQGRSDDASQEMLRFRNEERIQVREKSKELGEEIQERKRERKEEKLLEKHERVQTKEQEQKQKGKMFQQFERGRNSGERRTSPGRGGRGR